MKVIVDRELCIGAANCVAIAPTVFRLDEENKSVPFNPHGADDTTLEEAANACPTQAIILENE
ncbi:MAG: ferredoxin [Chloroflexi bacterium]|nr:ferredoxin [Chloroflexota bacterium]